MEQLALRGLATQQRVLDLVRDITVAERRTVRTPSGLSASRTDPTVRGAATNAELTLRRRQLVADDVVAAIGDGMADDCNRGSLDGCAHTA